MINVVIISPEDNVGVVIEWIKKGEILNYDTLDGKSHSIESLDDIRIYHKVAIEEIKKGDFIVKYGEHIGVASNDIGIGEHVHSHNVDDYREDLTLAE